MHVACGKCLQCRTGQAHICQHVKIFGIDRDGAFASYVVIPESNIWKLDPPSRMSTPPSLTLLVMRYTPHKKLVYHEIHHVYYEDAKSHESKY